MLHTAHAHAGATGGITASTNRLVPWWSISKAVLAVATLRLADQGRLRLDEPFRDRPFSVRQLLQHTAGVRTYGGDAYRRSVARSEPAWPVEDMLARVKAEVLNFEPGTGWSYCNIGYLFIRQLIEETVGAQLDTGLRHLVFETLGMATARIAMTRDDLAGTLWGNAGGYDPGWVYHGLVIGAPADAVRFLHQIQASAILSDKAQAAMLAVHPVGGALPGRPWTKTGYGIGLMIGEMAGAGRAFGHSGVGPDSVAALYHFPQLDPPVTAAAFAMADDEALVEHETVRLALA